MRLRFARAMILIAAAPLLVTQGKAQKNAPAPPKPITLSGCVARTTDADQFTLSDSQDGTTYRLSGADVHGYVGQRVQIVGRVAGSKKLQIGFGLKPSPNVAAQAGAIDPSQMATAVAGGLAPTGNVQLPEFRVRTVRPLGASCP